MWTNDGYKIVNPPLHPLGGPPTEQPRRQEENSPHEGEQRLKRNPDQPKRQRQQPDEREEDEREERQGPAKHQENAPADKKNQRFHAVIFSPDGAASSSPGKPIRFFTAATSC